MLCPQHAALCEESHFISTKVSSHLKPNCFPCTIVCYEITIAWKSLVTIFPASAAEVEHRGEGGREQRLQGGKGSGKKVERENRECTCNLTVMKGTPRKECNTTKESVGWGLTKKRERSWISNALPENTASSSRSGGPREMTKPSRAAFPTI